MSSGFLVGPERFGDLPRGLDRAVEAWRQDRAAVDRPRRGGCGRRQSRLRARSAPLRRVEHGAAAAVAVRVDKVGDGEVEAGLTQRLDDKTALPGPVMVVLPVLHGAAAAYAEMRADRRDALRTRLFDLEEAPPVGVAGDRFDLDGFARQRTGNVNRAGGRRRRRRRRDGRAGRSAAAQPRSAPMKNSRLPSPPRIGEGVIPPTRHPWVGRNAAMSLQTD